MSKQNRHDEIAISVQNVSKTFLLPHEKTTSIKSGIINIFRKKNRTVEKQQALKDISFDVKKGEFLGIVGRNGSGKSTMLKILAGIYKPTSGKVHVNGKLTPFIELGVGFNPELSGRDNVYLNGALLGFSRDEVASMYDDIVQFAELEKFMDQKLKNYSSGMQVRLAFSIAIRANTDILVLDEVLAVGDEAFQRKCFEYFAKLKRDKKTVILVTHNMDQVQQFCTRAILIDKGHKTEIGSPLKISQIYSELNNSKDVTVNDNKLETGTKYLAATCKQSVVAGERVFEINLVQRQEMEEPVFAFGIYSETGEEVYRWASDEKLPYVFDPKIHTQFTIKVMDIFPVGKFMVNLYLKKRDRSIDYAIFNGIATFQKNNTSDYARDIRWKIPDTVSVNNKEI
jgi:ABC-2 type transport system ATP-binding protein